MSSSVDITNDASWPEVPDADALEDWRLLQRARGGCPDSFRALVERHQQRLYHFCFRYLRDEGDAKEVCQDTFVRAHGALSRFKPKARVSTWLYQIALNLCRDRARVVSKKRPALRLEHTELVCAAGTPAERAVLGADLAKLDRGLAELPLKSRAVLVLSCLDGLSHEECATILKCSERAVEGRLYRARRQLMDWWEREA
jgi:RNA polymerase sigma-70 factor (ECF subfamily)